MTRADCAKESHRQNAKPLAGAAKNYFMKKCETGARAAKQVLSKQ